VVRLRQRRGLRTGLRGRLGRHADAEAFGGAAWKTLFVRRLLGAFVVVVLATGAAGSASSNSAQPPLHRVCPPGNGRTPYLRASFDDALRQVKRVVYGQKITEQGQTVITSPRNTDLSASMHVQRGVTLVPAMQAWYRVMQHRCRSHTPPVAWGFDFAIPTNAPDFSPYFLVRAKNGWYVF
jgi:hypothetical protein